MTKRLKSFIQEMGMAGLLLLGAALFFSPGVKARDTVAGALVTRGGSEQTTTFTPYDAATGTYGVTIHKPTAVFFEDPGVAGVVAEKDTNPNHKGSVWVVPYAKNPAYFEGATVHVCKLQGEWTCGSGDLASIGSGSDAKPYASGIIKDSKVVLSLKPSEVALKKFAADKNYDRSIEGFTLFIQPASGAKRAWLATTPQTLAKAANGSPAHAWAINLANGTVVPFATVKGGQQQFAGVIKQ